MPRYGETHADRGRATATTTCQDCGATVSPRFVRVFGDNDGTVHGCLECSTYTDLANGECTDPGGGD